MMRTAWTMSMSLSIAIALASFAFGFGFGCGGDGDGEESSAAQRGKAAENQPAGSPSPLPGDGHPSSDSPANGAGGETPGKAKDSPADQGEGDGSDVVAIGDSYMRLPNVAQQPGDEGVDLSLQKISGRPYRTFAFKGGRLFPPLAVGVKNGVIPNQFTGAKREGAIKTVLATGGGNDLPQGGGPCKGAATADAISAECKSLIDGINEAIDKLVADMAAEGVKDLIWIGYGPTDPSQGLEGAIAALRAARKAKCVANNPALGLRCHYIDTVAAQIPTRDGFHPTAEGYTAIATAVFDRMKKEGARR